MCEFVNFLQIPLIRGMPMLRNC